MRNELHNTFIYKHKDAHKEKQNQ